MNDIASGTVLLQQPDILSAEGEKHLEHLQIGLHLLWEAAQLHEILVQLLLGTEPVVVGLEAHRRVLAGEDETGGLFAVVGFQQGFRLIGHEGAHAVAENAEGFIAGEVRNARRRRLGDSHEAFGVGLFPLIASAGVFIQVEVSLVQRLYLPQKVEIKRKSTGVWKTNQFHKFLSIHWFYNHRNGFFCAIHGSMSAKVTGTITAERSVRSVGTQIERQ